MIFRLCGSNLYININSILILFSIRPIVSIKIANFQQVPEFVALKGFLDRRVTRQKAKWFAGSEKREKTRLGTEHQYGD